MKKTSTIIWGLVFVAVGTVLALNALHITDISLFFRGWWTLFIIVPCAVDLVCSHNKVSSAIGLFVGIFLLLCCRKVISFAIFWKLLVPAIIVAIGLKLIFNALRSNKPRSNDIIIDPDKDFDCQGTATFSTCNMDFKGKLFEGAELNAIFGEVKCDLTDAIITNNCVIDATAVFGGIKITVPSYVNVQIKSDSIFGGVTNKTNYNESNTVTVCIRCHCMFGGVTVK